MLQCLGDSAEYAGQSEHFFNMFGISQSGQAFHGFQCLGDTSAEYAGQAEYFFNVSSISQSGKALHCSNVWVTPLLDMLARPIISSICPVYLGLARLCIDPGRTLYSSNVWVTPLVDMLARPRIPPMSG